MAITALQDEYADGCIHEPMSGKLSEYGDTGSPFGVQLWSHGVFLQFCVTCTVDCGKYTPMSVLVHIRCSINCWRAGLHATAARIHGGK